MAGIRGTGAPGDPLIFQSQNLAAAEIYGFEFKGETSLDFMHQDLAESSAQFESPNAFTVDLVGRWQVSQNVSINAGIYNLTNQKLWLYQDVRGQAPTSDRLDQFTQPGINGRVAVTVKF
ncbi:MAG: hypothetical protein RL015_2882 [Verrucomicrobiota bacterium]